MNSTRRKPEYLSPSALKTFETNKDDYYVKYLSPVKLAREPQTKPMAAGSAFDAYVKSFLHDKLFGAGHKESNKYQLEALLTAQVEAHNRDWARVVGKYLFEVYSGYGCLADLMTELSKSAIDPRFEFDVKGVVETPHGVEKEPISRKVNGVSLLGKPDVIFTTESGHTIIHDWKVSGYCSSYTTSPVAGYIKLKPGSQSHKDCMPMMFNGVMIDCTYFEQRQMDWAEQLSTYAWLLGCQVGSEFVVSIDQLVCKGGSKEGDKLPDIRVAYHRAKVASQTQYNLLARYIDLWSRITSEPFYFFTERSFEDSQAQCDLLDKQAHLLYGGPTDEKEAWLMDSAKQEPNAVFKRTR